MTSRLRVPGTRYARPRGGHDYDFQTRAGLIYAKVHKAALSTLAGITLHVAENYGRRRCQNSNDNDNATSMTASAYAAYIISMATLLSFTNVIALDPLYSRPLDTRSVEQWVGFSMMGLSREVEQPKERFYYNCDLAITILCDAQSAGHR